MKPTKFEDRSPKNFWVLLALWLFIGYFGAYRIYVGRGSWLYTLTAGYLMLGWLYDLFVILFIQFRDNQGLTVRP